MPLKAISRWGEEFGVGVVEGHRVVVPRLVFIPSVAGDGGVRIDPIGILQRTSISGPVGGASGVSCGP